MMNSNIPQRDRTPRTPVQNANKRTNGKALPDTNRVQQTRQTQSAKPTRQIFPRQVRRARKRKPPILNYYIVFLIVAIGIFVVLLTVQSNKNKREEASASAVNTSETNAVTTSETTPVTTTTEVKEEPVPTFTADLSAYEEYMNPQGDKRDAFLILVNSQNPLDENYIPENLTDLVNTRKDGRTTQQMCLYAAKSLEALYIDADANGMLNDSTGYTLSVTSAYRSYAKQNSNFNNYVSQEMKADKTLSKAEAEKIVAVYCNPAGNSEHQTGLCCDMHNQVSANSDYPEVFANTKEGKWLTENCWKYGFVLRYPEDKQDVTNITYESWHFRYVGRYHAKRMTELNMCLEEYTEYLNEN